MPARCPRAKRAGFGLTYCNILPGFVSSEIRPREPIRYFQRVLILTRRKGHAAQDCQRH